MVSLCWDLWSHKPLWTGVDFGCSLPSVAGNVAARRLQTPASLKIWWITSFGTAASAVVFTNLVELASLHEISQLTDVEKQQLQPNTTVPSFSGLLTLSIVALEEEGVHVHV